MARKKAKQKNIDFLQQYDLAGKPRAARRKQSPGWLLFPLVLAALIAAFTGKCYFDIHRMERTLAEMEAYETDPAVQAQLEAAAALRRELTEMQAQVTTRKGLQAYLSTYSVPDRPVFETLALAAEASGTVEIDEWHYDRNSGTFTIKGIGALEDSGAEMLSRLRALDFFQDFAYYGYAAQWDGGYAFEIICYVKAVGGNAF